MGKCKARWRVERRDDKREEALLHDFGVQLRWLREQRRMTLEEAEARSGVSTSSLSAYERGEGNPTLRTVMLLAESYQVPLSGLLREKDREPDCTQAASACLLQCIEAMSGVLRRGATQPELKQCAAECIGWLESILRTDRRRTGERGQGGKREPRGRMRTEERFAPHVRRVQTYMSRSQSDA